MTDMMEGDEDSSPSCWLSCWLSIYICLVEMWLNVMRSQSVVLRDMKAILSRFFPFSSSSSSSLGHFQSFNNRRVCVCDDLLTSCVCLFALIYKEKKERLCC